MWVFSPTAVGTQRHSPGHRPSPGTKPPRIPQGGASSRTAPREWWTGWLAGGGCGGCIWAGREGRGGGGVRWSKYKLPEMTVT